VSVNPNKIRLAENIDIWWTEDRYDAVRCPNCGATDAAPRLLEIDYRPGAGQFKYIVHGCAGCGAKFFDNTRTMDYGTDELIEIGWHVYQIQIGAGLWPIAAPLTRIDKPAGARILEIGGAYGFGLDFGIRGRDWVGEGYDPSPLAAFGANELGLHLKQDYFTERDLGQARYDVILATEVIEHLVDPPAFLSLAFRALAGDGILLLTTPDGERITPALPATDLLPMLSPGAHLVLQNAASLRMALGIAGFAHVAIIRSENSLTAYASASAFEINDDPGASRAAYRRYLLERGKLTPSGSDLCFGFAGRGLFEAVNDGDFAAAEAAWQILLPAARQRFGLELESIAELPAGAGTASLAELHRLIPLGLGMILYSRALWRAQRGDGREALLPLFRLAAAALDALQAALGRRSLTDALTTGLRAAAETEIILCLAAAGDPDCLTAVTALLAREPGHRVIAWRAFISLINAGAFIPARALQEAVGLYAPDDAAVGPLRDDALFTTGVLALQERWDWPRAVAIFAQLRTLLLQSAPPREQPGHLFWPALRGEIKALQNLDRHDEATALLNKFIPAYDGAPDDLYV
jgi:SAM-dependent methyltransferase